MSAKDCIDTIIKASKGALSEEDLADLQDTLAKRAARRAKQFPLESREQNMAAVAGEMAQEEEIAAVIEKRNRAINVLKKQERLAFYEANKDIAPVGGKFGLKGQAAAISALNVGSQRGFEGAALSVDAQSQGLRTDLVGGMVAELRQSGLLPMLASRSRDFDRDVARELFRLSEPNGTASGNKLAEDVAKILGKAQEAARVMQNDAGAYIRKLPGYIVRQTHDAVAILSAGREQWKADIAGLLDDSTFDGVKDKDAFLDNVFDAVSSGVHNQQNGGEWLGGFTGPANRAKKISQERLLHFKDADAWFDYNQRYGSQSVLEAVVHGLDNAARNTALMRVWGTNPQAAFDADIRQLLAANRTDEALKRDLMNKRLRDEFAQVNGTANQGGLPSKARFHANVRAYISMTKLGGVALSSFPDIAVQASTLRHNGINYFEGLANGFQNLVRGRAAGEAREIADYVAAGIDGTIGSVFDRFGTNETMGGRMSRLMRFYFKANLLSWWTDSMKTGVGLILSRNLADLQAKGFGELPELLQTNLRRYGIGDKEWGLYRELDTKLGDGAQHLTADAIDDLPDERIAQFISEDSPSADKLRRARLDLKTKLNTYYADQIREAATEPGARDRAIGTWGTAAGTSVGEAIRYLMQFKTFGISFATKHIAREFLRTGQLDKTGIFALIVGTTAMGYAAMTAKEFVKGKNPREVTDAKSLAKVIGASMVQGGGLGIYGDFLFGDYNRFGGGAVETLAGPVVGTAGDLARLWGKLRDSATSNDWWTALKKTRSAALRFGLDNTAFLNLFYTRMALDHMLFFKWQEAMNPGYLQRMERNLYTESGQTYWLKPSSAVR